MLAGRLNEVSDSGLIQTNRGGFVSSQDRWPLPAPVLWELARVTQATHLLSIHPLLPLWKSDHSHTLIPIAPFAFLVTGKASLAFKKMPLCVALCRRSCASPVRLMRCWEERTLLSPPSKREAVHPLRITATYVDMGVFTQIVFRQGAQTMSESTSGPGKSYNFTKTR